MKSLSYAFSVPGGVEQVGALLLDPDVVAACLPGATLTRRQGGSFSGSFRAKLGSEPLTYLGDGTLTVDGRNSAIVLSVRGLDRRSGHRADVRVTTELISEGPSTTLVRLESRIDLEGLTEHLAEQTLPEAADELANAFAAKLARRLRTTAGPDPRTRVQPGVPLTDIDPTDPTSPGWLYGNPSGTEPNDSAPVFVSYSQIDGDAVGTLIEDLRIAGVPVWRDSYLDIGDAWWAEILRRIREAPVFVQALSDAAQDSEACRIEHIYAEQLGIPVLPVQVGAIDVGISPFGNRQMIDYRGGDKRAAIRLVAALMRRTMRRGPLPTDLPHEPPAPGAYLHLIAAELNAQKLDVDTQLRIVDSLRGRLERTKEPIEIRQIRTLLKRLVDRKDANFHAARTAQAVLDGP